ncbi:CHAT domain-containing protein [Streptomyces halobius]|uniref:CHAT domain-containing protein n=1 Tax=Streptomyces halobius TaxID=2879846 RepID=A0ABY4M1P2_9ACTN|nr:CHAT domain-containing protein [Streptomyces halobius]UQA90794.1 CHAT domain-containing protein [Streptomyces halobius]
MKRSSQRFADSVPVAEIDRMVREWRAELATLSEDTLERRKQAEVLAMTLHQRFLRTRSEPDLDEAIALVRENLPGAGGQHLLGILLQERSRVRRGGSDLTAAIAAFRAAMAHHRDNSEAGHTARLNLAGLLEQKYEQDHDRAAVDEAVEICVGEVSWAMADGDDDRTATSLLALGQALSVRALHSGVAADATAAVDALRRAADLTLPGSDDECVFLQSLGSALYFLYRRNGDPEVLEEAIDALSAALYVAGTDIRNRALIVSNLLPPLRARFERTGSGERLDELIGMCRELADGVPEGSTDRAFVVLNRCSAQLLRHRHSGRDADLQETLDDLGGLLAGPPLPGPLGRRVLGTRAIALRRKFERTYDTGWLDQAVDAARQALDTQPREDFSGYYAACSALASTLATRCSHRGSLADLQEAVTLFGTGLQNLPETYADRHVGWSDHGRVLLQLYDRTGDPDLLDQALTACASAVELLPQGHTRLPDYLNNLSAALLARYVSDGRPADLEAVIATRRHALRLLPDGHPDIPARHGGLCIALRHLYEHTGSSDAREQAVRNGREALADLAEEHPDWPGYAYNLAAALPPKEAVPLFRKAQAHPTAPARLRLHAAMAWGRAATGTGDRESAAEGYAAAVAHLPQAAWLGPDLSVRQHFLTEAWGAGCEAAAAHLALGQPERAVELLEQGRGVLLSQALDLQADLTRLRAVDERLARELDAVLRALESAASQETDVTDRQRLADRRTALLARARSLDGLHDFLAAPAYAQLSVAAAEGPVVLLNTAASRCDAIVVEADRPPRFRQLRTLSLDAVREQARLLDEAFRGGDTAHIRDTLTTLLDWLWQHICAEVLDDLLDYRGEPGPDGRLPRVWWCPTGLLTLLPVHAAGRYEDEDGQGDSLGRPAVPLRVVSSYTPTLRALIDARSRRVPAADPSQSADASMTVLAVPRSAALDARPLPKAEKEAREVADRIPGVRPLIGPDATRDRLLTGLRTRPSLHFAGHGYQHLADPVRSFLLCHDGTVTVSDVAAHRSPAAELAFLSSCESARSTVGQADEAVHLAGAMQLAGFRHVIATQWALSDVIAPEVAETVYADLGPATPGNWADGAARALHKAVAAQRATAPDDPDLWATYVHVGP